MTINWHAPPVPPYHVLFRLWLKGQIAVLFAGAVIYIGSLALSPAWPLAQRVVAALLLPAMFEIGFTAFCLVMAMRLWRVSRALVKVDAK
jgi:hypothetical protein